MKKVLSLLAATSLIAGTSAFTVSCGNTTIYLPSLVQDNYLGEIICNDFSERETSVLNEFVKKYASDTSLRVNDLKIKILNYNENNSSAKYRKAIIYSLKPNITGSVGIRYTSKIFLPSLIKNKDYNLRQTFYSKKSILEAFMNKTNPWNIKQNNLNVVFFPPLWDGQKNRNKELIVMAKDNCQSCLGQVSFEYSIETVNLNNLPIKDLGEISFNEQEKKLQF